MKYFTVIFSVLILIFLFSNRIYAVDPPSIEQEEAPATVWDMDIGDTEVDLYLTGYWKIGILGGVSVESGPTGVVFPAAYPGLTDFRFYQEPDLTISLWLMNRFYVETSFLEGFDKNTYAIGYRGQEGEFVQSVRIGNSDIRIDDYKGINVPSPKYNTPGVSASFQTANSYHDILFRYDPTSEHKKVFLGEYEIIEEEINIGSYSRGRFFILPDNNLDSIEVYIADKNGIYAGSDNKKYKKATDNEVYYSLEDGTVTLIEASETDVLVYYEKGGNKVGDVIVSNFMPPLINGEPDPSDTGNYIDFSWGSRDYWWYPNPATETFNDTSTVTVNSRKSLRVFNPHKLGPFEYFNIYNISSLLPPDIWRTTIFLADNSLIKTDDSDENYLFKLNIDDDLEFDIYDNLVSVFNNTDTDIRSVWSRYPFADNYPQLYGSEETDISLTGRSLLLTIKKQNGLTLGSGVVPGSEQIFINGYETSSAVVDYSSGKISFNKFIFPHDRIEVFYRTETTDLSGGDLLFAQGNRFYPSDYLQFHLAEMFRWNVAKNSSSTVDTTSPGGLTIAGGLTFNKDNLYIELTSSLGLQTHDTTGYLRLLGMEKSGYSFSVGESLVKTSPLNIWDGAGTLASANRADLIYTNYYSTNGLGQYFLNNYSWTGATIDNTLEGPSIASKLSSDSFDSNVMMMEYNVDGTEWSAGDLLLSLDDPIDLSRFTSISMNFKKLDTTGGNIVVKILLGETGEREDWDEDGFVNNEDESLIVVLSPTLPGSDGVWTTYKYYFTPSEMKKLTKSRSVRVLIDDSSPVASGKLLISGVHFDGSLFDSELFNNLDAEISADDKFNVSEIGDTIAYSLATSFSEIVERFHPAGEDQKALKIKWGDPDAILISDYWVVTTNTSPVPADTYKNFSFYVNNDAASLGGTYTISLTDSQDRGYSFSYSPGSIGWEKLSLSLETENVTDSSGSILASASKSPEFGELTKFRITGTGTTTGTMYIDELHFSEPTFSIKGNVELITEYSFPGDIISTAGGFPILADFAISNIFSYSGGSVLSTVSESVNSIQNSTSLSFDLLMLSIGANLKVDWDQSSTDLSGSHILKFPSHFSFGYISDSYSREGSGDSASMTRTNTFRFNFPNAGNLEISTGTNGNDDIMLQTWDGQTEWTIASLIHIGISLRFEQNSDWDKRDQNDYFSNWIYDYRLIIPETELVKTRSVKSNLDLELETVPLGFTLKPYLSFDNELFTSTNDSKQTNRGGFVMTIPIKLISKSDKEWSIIPSYSRAFMDKSTKPFNDSFVDGLDYLFTDLSSWIPLTTFIPFYELFATATVDKFENGTSGFDEVSYSPDFGISINRKFGSFIYDLFLPHSFNVHFIRVLGKKEDTFSYNNRFEFSFKQTAINLFGNFGVFQTFSFYNTEELTSSLQFNMDVEGSNIPQPEELIFQNYLSFYGNNNTVITLENRFEADFVDTYLSDTLDFKVFWQRPMKEKFALKILNDLINKEHFWSHEESLGLKFQYPWQQSENILTSSIGINVKHLSKLTVPGIGALRAWLKLGFFSEDELFRAGFEAGIELEVSF